MTVASTRPQEFLESVRDRAASALPEELRAFRGKVAYGTLQVHYGNPRVHYEVWLVRKTGRIEVGLHFEGEAEENVRAAAVLAPHVHEIRATAGDDVELEQWTSTWTRLHVTLPLGPLTDALCEETAARLATLIAASVPLLGEMATDARPRTVHGNGRRWERRRAAAGVR
jgi:hypothetical protein